MKMRRTRERAKCDGDSNLNNKNMILDDSVRLQRATK